MNILIPDEGPYSSAFKSRVQILSLFTFFAVLMFVCCHSLTIITFRTCPPLKKYYVRYTNWSKNISKTTKITEHCSNRSFKMSLVSGNSFEIVRPVSWKWRQQVQQRPTFRSCKGQNPPCFWLHFFPRALPPAVIYYSLVSSKSSTHYLSDTNRFDVSSKGPSSGITLIPDEGPLLETSIKGKS